MSFLSRFFWCLSAVGPSLLYGSLAALLTWACVTGGWSLHGWVPSVQSAAAIPCGGLALVLAGVVVSEWQHAASVRRLVARRAAIRASGR